MKLYQPQLNGRTLHYFRKLIFYLLAYKEAIVSLFGFVIPVLGFNSTWFYRMQHNAISHHAPNGITSGRITSGHLKDIRIALQSSWAPLSHHRVPPSMI